MESSKYKMKKPSEWGVVEGDFYGFTAILDAVDSLADLIKEFREEL